MAQSTKQSAPSRSEKDPVISLVVPMYEEEAVIERNITSLCQTMTGLGPTWEIVVVNDGSRDRSREIVAALTEKEKRVRLVSYPRNRGRGYAR